MKQTQRHDAIIELARIQGYVSTEKLVEYFNVSPQTIRRDLNELAEKIKFSVITEVPRFLQVLLIRLTMIVK